MNKCRVLLLLVSSLLLVGCGETPKPDPKSTYQITWLNYDNTVLRVDSVEEGVLPTYGGVPTRPSTDKYNYIFKGWNPEVVVASKDTSYTATYTEEEIPPDPEPIKTITISEARILCMRLTHLNVSGIKVDMTQKVKIKGFCFAKTNLVKTKSAYGLNESAPGKVLLGDETGFIACASDPGNDGNTLYGKVADHAGEENSKYEVTGYISRYLDQPEIYVPSDKSYYTYNPYLNVSFNPNSFAEQVDFTKYYQEAVDLKYNCAGHSYGKIISIKGVSIIDSIDGGTYIGTNGSKVINIKKANCVLSKGYCYDLVGIMQSNNYIPSLSLLSCKISATEFTNIKKQSAISKTISEFISSMKKMPFDDTLDRQDELIQSFQFIYKSFGYISAYNKNGKLYTTFAENYSTSKEYPTRESAISKGAISVRNDSCWNRTQEQIYQYSCLKEYMDEEIQTELIYSPILFEDLTYNKVKYHEWKIYVVESLIEPVTTGE